MTSTIHIGGHYYAVVHDASALPDPPGESVHPHVGVGTTVQRPAQKEQLVRLRQARDTRLFDIPSQPRDFIKSSTRRVDTPST